MVVPTAVPPVTVPNWRSIVSFASSEESFWSSMDNVKLRMQSRMAAAERAGEDKMRAARRVARAQRVMFDAQRKTWKEEVKQRDEVREHELRERMDRKSRHLEHVHANDSEAVEADRHAKHARQLQVRLEMERARNERLSEYRQRASER